LRSTQPPAQAARCFGRASHQLSKLPSKTEPFFLLARQPFQLPGLIAKLPHTASHSLQSLHQRVDLAHTNAQFFDQRDCSAPALIQAGSRRATLSPWPPRRGSATEVAAVALDKLVQCLQVLRHTSHDLTLIQVFGRRHTQRSRERQRSLLHLLQQAHRAHKA
jgi:hypothetical protein